MKVFVLTGPTGVGKSEVAVLLARKFHLEIISADSRAIYRYLDIGTAKPAKELRAEIRFHLIDLIEPTERYSAVDYARDAEKVMKTLAESGRRFIIVGGAGFYLRALFQPLFPVPRHNPELRARLAKAPVAVLYHRLQTIDPQRARELHPHDRQRIIRALEVYELTGKTFTQLAASPKRETEFTPVYAVLTMERKRLYQRLEARFDQMMAAGLLDEVKRLKEMGLGQGTGVVKAYGYAELLRHLEGELTLEAAKALAKKRTKEYARRQLTWLRGLKTAHWFEFTTAAETALKLEPLLLDTLASVF